jgi:hypothetical protein
LIVIKNEKCTVEIENGVFVYWRDDEQGTENYRDITNASPEEQTAICEILTDLQEVLNSSVRKLEAASHFSKS